MMTRRLSSLAVAIATAGALGAACGTAKEPVTPTPVPRPAIVAVTGVTLKSSTSLVVGGTERLTAVVAPTNASDQRLQWTSSDSGVATVAALAGTGQAQVTAVAAGEATIKVVTADGGFSAACRVTVAAEKVAVSGVTVEPGVAKLTLGGAPVALSATVAPAGATNQTVTWTTSNASVELSATTGSSVMVSPRSVGAAVVTARTADGGFTATAQLTVLPVAVTGVALSPRTLTLQAGSPDGTSAQLVATISPSNATYQGVSWMTSDSSVATVTTTVTGPGTTTATVLAHAAGTAAITVTTVDGGKIDTCQVKVEAPPPEVVAVTGLSLDRAPTAVLDLEAGSPGTSGALVATVTPDTATDKRVSWISSDPAVAVLSAGTGSAVTVTGGTAGTATITASTVSGAKTASTGVKVWLLDAQIAGTTASGSFWARADAPGYYSTKAPTASNYDEVAVGKLLYYADDKGFQDGDADGGIQLFYYGSGSATDPVARGATPTAKAYLGIPAARTTTTQASVKVTVTAKAQGGSPRIALTKDGRVFAVSDVLTAAMADYVFDGAPANAQLDVLDGGPDGSSLSVKAIRVEPSATATADYTPPLDVAGLTTSAVSTTAVTLSWTPPPDVDLAYYEISYGAPAVVTTVASTATGASVTGLSAGTTYTFTVKAVDAAGLSSPGATATATTLFEPMLDESLPDGDLVESLASTAATAGLQEVSVPGSKLAFYVRPATATAAVMFKSYGTSKLFMFPTSGLDPNGIATGTAVKGASTKAYVAVPAASMSPPAAFQSVRVTVTASQPINTSTVLNGKTASVVLLDAAAPPFTSAGPKVLATAPLPAAVSGVATRPSTIVFDGLTPGAAVKISCDFKQVVLHHVKVEGSMSPPNRPTVTIE